MKKHPIPAPIYDYLSTLSPAVRAALQNNDIYQRFLAAQKELEKLAAASMAQTGRLTSPAVLAQSRTVEALGEEVLALAQKMDTTGRRG
ncbi:MAG: hypothetical protein Q4E65_05935 [Clostridia bacterium]|nr:hypothetical protein [Clostridia bacterium]